MLRLSRPIHTFEQSIDDCGAGIADHMPLKAKLSNGKLEMIAAGAQYSAAALAGNLSAIAPFHGTSQEVVIAGMTKGELVRVYDQYFVPEEKVARRVYDALMNSARERCPFCGGIGTPRNLGHFLPKAFFPQFSVLPINLVPACRDCNMDAKGHAIAATAEEQPIQPYLDDEKFFNEQWVFATYHAGKAGEIGQIEYFAFPPEHWSSVEKSKACRHFENFDLAKRYSIKAAEHLSMVFSQMERMRSRGLGQADVRHVLLEPGVDRAPFINHWQRGLYQALM